MLRIAIDAKGGDFGPSPIVEGTIQALYACKKSFHAILVGEESELKPLVPDNLLKNISFVQANECVNMEESASGAIKKRDSSIYKAIELVKEKKADAVVSAGHSGATMGLATLKIGRIEGIIRPAIATLMPTLNSSHTLVLDVGANVDCKSEHLFQFAIMGEAYAKEVLKIKHPKLGLLSNGEEPSKGNETTKEAFRKIKRLDSFVGNVEGNNIFDGSVDVVICDGFVGNIVLKTSEGVAESITKIIKHNIQRSAVAITGAVLMRKVFKILKKQVDYAEYGGAPLLGIDGCAIVSHGKSNAKAIKNAIFQAIAFSNSTINSQIQNQIAHYKEG
ncbi:MAG: phosphate acyltransferase PlsX [Sulfurospirillaceae bacterium]|jgi:glycerol-3-phosphate acyltransferase PlsX|nr:phosphate acyltransferase PlsX [Sulfurospirillaceae bacterium]MDY0237427.1 phosphate acyltransferase PlsX [Campylobacterales bacterium]